MQKILLAVRPRVPNPQTGRSSPKLSLVPMPPDEIDKSAQFKRWLALFFIGQGKYKITEKGYAELAPQEIRHDTHIGDRYSAKERTPAGEITNRLIQREIKEKVARKVEEMLRNGKAAELYDKGYVVRSQFVGWGNREVHITVVKKLLEFLGASPARLDQLREELIDTNRLQEISNEIRNNLERIRKVSTDDFKNNGLGGWLGNYYKNSPYFVLLEVGYAYSLEEIREHARTGEFKIDKLYPWEMNNVKIYTEKELRIAATKWLVWKLKKPPTEIMANDFNNNKLSGLLVNHCNHSPYEALLEAGLVTPADEAYMRRRGRARFN